VSGNLVQPDVTLTLLFGVVEREAVQKGPHQLPRNSGQTEFESRVLVHRMVTTVERQRTDRPTLTIGDFVGLDHT
jgi:hypothetical protein